MTLARSRERWIAGYHRGRAAFPFPLSQSRYFKQVLVIIFVATWSNAAIVLTFSPPSWNCSGHPVLPIVGLGVLTGAALYWGALRRLTLPFTRTPRLPLARILPVGAVLLLQATAEEILFRGVLLDLVVAQTGPFWGAAASTVAFAVAHYPVQGRVGVRSHLMTGAAFGLLAVTTGGVLAPVVAHAVFSLLVLVERTRVPPRDGRPRRIEASGTLNPEMPD